MYSFHTLLRTPSLLLGARIFGYSSFAISEKNWKLTRSYNGRDIISFFSNCILLRLSNAIFQAYAFDLLTLLFVKSAQLPLIGVQLFFILWIFCAAWMYLCPRWPSRSSDWKCLLGVVLLGAWNSAWRPDAERQDYRRRRRFLQHVFQRDWSRKTCSSRRVCWFGTNCCR